MRKPIEVRSDADLQAIQTSVAFKNISDAIEQYRRQFGLAFLALIAFSAIHVGLVVIANLYTLETRVENGVLTSAKSSSVSTPTPVATATLEHNSDLEHIMSNVNAVDQKKMIASIKSVDFVDREGNYRQYTVTGFKLSGFKNSDLSLYTSVGHVLQYVRGKGLRVTSEGQSCNCTSEKTSGRKLLASMAMQAAVNRGYGDHITSKAECVDSVTVQYLRTGSNYVGTLGQVNIPKATISSFNDDMWGCLFGDLGGVGYSMSEADNSFGTALSKHMTLATAAATSATAILQQVRDEIVAEQAFWSRSQYRGEGLNWSEWDNSVCLLSKFEGLGGRDATCNIMHRDIMGGDDTVLISVEDMMDKDPTALQEFMDNFDTTCKGHFIKSEFDAFVALYTSDSSATESSAVGRWLDQAVQNSADNAREVQRILSEYTGKSWKATTLKNIVRDIVYAQAEVGQLDGNGMLSRNVQYDPEHGWMDSQKDSTEQSIFYNGWYLAYSLWWDFQARVDSEAQACAEKNAANFAILGMTFVNAALQYVGSSAWEEHTREAFTESWESAQMIASQESTKCAQAASDCFFAQHAGALGSMCNQGATAVGALTADCSLVASGKYEVLGIDGQVRQVSLAPCGSPGRRAFGCTTEPLFAMYYNTATLDFDDMQATANLGDVVGENHVNNYRNFIEETTAMHGTNDAVEIVMTWIDTLISTRMNTFISDAEGEWDVIKNTNMWDNGKHVRDGEVVRSTSGYGCSSTSAESMSAYDTLIPVMAIAACKVESGDTHKLPMINGAMFSSILGGYDSYSIYIPPKMCAMVNAAMALDTTAQMSAISANLQVAARGASLNSYIDYVIMLHGWGGTNAWMNTISLVFNYGMAGRHGWSTQQTDDFNACHTSAQMSSRSCVSHVAPGGFAIIAPNGGSVPIACRHWWFNSEFTGFLLDYVVFDLPANFLHMTGVDGRTASVFGYSMGGWGVMLVLNTFPKLAAAGASYNAPLYPSDCFFAYICHHACITDPIYCEILFTTMGMVVNSYVIVFQDGAVTSSGSMDPMGMGVAVQLSQSVSGNKIIQCRKSEADAQALVEVIDTLSWTGIYTGVPDIGANSVNTQCSHQNWNSFKAKGDGCARMLELPSMNGGLLGDYQAKSVHVNIPAMSRDLSNYKCTLCNYSEADTKDPLDPSTTIAGNSYYAGLYGYSVRQNPTTGEEPTCPMSMCVDMDWCAEPNDAEETSKASTKYLNPVYLTVATMKFVPQSNAITDEAVPSAFREMHFASPATKLMNSVDGISTAVEGVTSVYGVTTVMLYLHCAQNDEAGNFQHHIVYAGMILGASLGDYGANSAWLSSSQFLMDFEDCDGHFYSERDIKGTLMWLSDSLRAFVGDEGGDEDFNVIRNDFLSNPVKMQDYLKTCWLSAVGDGSAAYFGGSYASGYNSGKSWTTITQAGRTCSLPGKDAIHGNNGGVAKGDYPSVYTEDEWHHIEKGNEIKIEPSHVIALMVEANEVLSSWKEPSCLDLLSENDLFQAGQGVVRGGTVPVGPGPTSNICSDKYEVYVDENGVSHTSEEDCKGIGCM
jgi:hypothetical protein